MKKQREKALDIPLPKTPTGIKGLDEITMGGLPSGRITLVLGSSGVGKTVLGMQFLVEGARLFDEPGLMVSFEETEQDLNANTASFGFDLAGLAKEGRVSVDYILLSPAEILEAGQYDLTGLLMRIEQGIERSGAKRVVLDGIPSLFYGFSDKAAVRGALWRIYSMLKSRQLTIVVTAGEETELARHGLGRSLADCIIAINERIVDGIATRHIRVVKYRGSAHGTSEYPFLIGREGLSVVPVTSIKPDYKASSERISTGIPDLDSMLGSGGYYRGSSVLITGWAGTGKTSMAAQLALAACKRGERCIYFVFEESEHEITRNMLTIGLDLRPQVGSGLLRFCSARATMYGLEMHLATMEREINEFEPQVVILDPVSNLLSTGTLSEARAMVFRLIDFLKNKGVTSLMTSLSSPEAQQSDIGVSSIVDTWIVLRNIEVNGEQSRLLNILKSRGTAHSNQVREFMLTKHGIELVDVYLGPSGFFTGTARIAREAKDREEVSQRENDLRRQRSHYEQKRAALEAQVAVLMDEIETAETEMEQIAQEAREREKGIVRQKKESAEKRGVNTGEKSTGVRRRGRPRKKI